MRAPSSPRGFWFDVSRVSGRVVVTAHGTFDSSASPTLDRVLRDLIDDQGNMAVVVDLGDVTVADLACTGVLLAAADSAASRGGELIVVAPPEAVGWALAAADARGGFAVTGQIARTP